MASLLRSCTGMQCFTARTAPVRRVGPAVSFAPRPQLVYTSPSCSFLGGSMTSSLYQPSSVRGRGALVIMANAKKSMGCTKEGTRRARRRTSGFRTRMSTTAGRKVLATRRAKGRKVLCPASKGLSGGKKK